MKKYDVITFGSGLVDAFLDCEFPEKNNFINLPVGTKIAVKNIKFSVGGGGTNTAAAFSKLGMKTGFLGKVAGGGNSYIILEQLRRHKVDFLGLKSKDKEEHAGYSIILLTDKKNRTILTYKGVSNTLKASEIDFKKINTNWIHFTSMDGIAFETQKKVSDFANKHNIKTSFNPSSYQTKQGLKHISSLIKNSYLLSLNKEEASMLVKGDLAKNLHKLGPEIVIITNGNKPGEVYDGEFRWTYYPNHVKLQGSTGAGDVFVSSFITGFNKTKDIENSIKIAMANTESILKTHWDKKELLSWNEVMNKIKHTKYKIKKEAV